MGLNSTVIVMNDALGAIEDDPDFGKNLAQAIKRQVGDHHSHVSVRAGNHHNAASVIEQHHANDTAVVAVGGNHASSLGIVAGCDNSHHTDKGKVQVLKRLADQMGYSLHKKRGT